MKRQTKNSPSFKRCPWVPADDPLYIAYHDKEWGVPVRDDKKLFEFLLLEAFQAGLSWRIILSKRQNFKKAFVGFDPSKVARFTKDDVDRLLENAGIIRNRLKIEAAINNAKRILEAQKEFGSFSNYQWQFVGEKPIMHKIKTLKDYPIKIKEAELMASDMKRRGFKFLGSTILYAHMQAVGMVNDHTLDCFRYMQLKQDCLDTNSPSIR